MEDIVFSIIVTAFNQPQEIRRAIDSVLNQTLTGFEVIVVDDCSTDETPQILNEYKEKHANVKIIRHQKNSSSHVARASGVEKAEGRFTIFLDGDDYLFPDALEKLLCQIVNAGEDFDVCEYSYQCQPSGQVYKPLIYDKSRPIIDFYLNHDSPVTVWNKLYRTEVVKKAFQNMQKSYIRCGDDTYETICIAYFTKKYIQRDILVTNYSAEGGVSLKKNTFESNLQHCRSLKNSLNALIDFFGKTDYKNSQQLIEMTEKRFFDWISKVMQDNTKSEDVVKSLLLLPEYFNSNIIEPVFSEVYPAIKRTVKIKRIIKKIKKLLHIKNKDFRSKR